MDEWVREKDGRKWFVLSEVGQAEMNPVPSAPKGPVERHEGEPLKHKKRIFYQCVSCQHEVVVTELLRLNLCPNCGVRGTLSREKH